MPGTASSANDRAFAEAIREKFALDEDNDQDILDQHVSRVWKDQTPHRSPGTMSPCPPIPSRRRTATHDSGMVSDGAMSLSKFDLSEFINQAFLIAAIFCMPQVGTQ